MTRKTLIQIAVIAICFGGAALVLYNGLFKKSSNTSSVSALEPGATESPELIEDVLLFGDDFEGELKRILKRNNLQYQTVSYPKANSAEAGIPVTDLVKPEPPAGSER